jgi:hypothetical protein
MFFKTSQPWYALRKILPIFFVEIGIPEERRKTLQNRIYKILFTLPTAPTPASTIGPSSERGYSTTGRHSIRKSLDSGPTGSTPGQTSAGLFILGQMKEPLVVPLPYEHSLRTTSFFPLHPSTILLVCPIFSDEFLVSCKVEFVGEVGYSGVPIQGNFHITSMFPEKITLSSITLHFVDTGTKGRKKWRARREGVNRDSVGVHKFMNRRIFFTFLRLPFERGN